MKNIVNIDRKRVGEGYPAFIVAEIGSNHNGEISLAKQLIEAAALAGVDAVKFQAFKAEKHYSTHTPTFNYLAQQEMAQSTFDLIKSLEINRDWHQELMTFCQQQGVEFLSSPCDRDAVDQLDELGMAAFKLSSFDLTDLDLVKHMASHKKPLLVSTGMADYGDILAIIKTVEQAGNDQVVLLQCTSLYPAPVEMANLETLNTLKQAFGVPVGYSDHTIGDHVAIAAVALGACMIEKHFTLDRNLPGPDHPFAIQPEELTMMVRRIREVEKAIGDGLKFGPRESERDMFFKGRRSLHVINAVMPGDRLKRSNMRIKRPGFGISPRFADIVDGMRVARSIAEDHWIIWEDLK